MQPSDSSKRIDIELKLIFIIILRPVVNLFQELNALISARFFRLVSTLNIIFYLFVKSTLSSAVLFLLFRWLQHAIAVTFRVCSRHLWRCERTEHLLALRRVQAVSSWHRPCHFLPEPLVGFRTHKPASWAYRVNVVVARQSARVDEVRVLAKATAVLLYHRHIIVLH